VWSSWNYIADDGLDRRPPSVTYWMNRLQGLAMRRNVFVSLNAARAPRDETVLREITYEHPLFDETRKDIGFLVPAFMLAVLAAPFFEEFVFRVLFQGFLESIAAGGIRGRNLWLGRAASSPAEIADFAKDQG
ncbi:MAG: hypothetical protein ACK53L_04355, partial [Pirellulaceae bacterium]